MLKLFWNKYKDVIEAFFVTLIGVILTDQIMRSGYIVIGTLFLFLWVMSYIVYCFWEFIREVKKEWDNNGKTGGRKEDSYRD